MSLDYDYNRKFLYGKHFAELVEICGGDVEKALQVKRIIRVYVRREERWKKKDQEAYFPEVEFERRNKAA